MTLDIRVLAEQVGIREDLHAGKKEWPTGFLEYGTDYADLTRFVRAVLEEAAKACDAQHDKARTSPGAMRAAACGDAIRALLPSEPK